MSWLFTSGGQSIGWSFSFNISPSSEYSGLISFRIDRFDLLNVPGTLKTTVQSGILGDCGTHSAVQPLPQRGGVYFPSRLDSGFAL